jgi:hypothetical protein
MNLTSVQRVKDFLGITSTGTDTAIGRLVTNGSDAIIQWCSRPFQRTVYAPAPLNGTGGKMMRTPDTPIVAVSSLNICNQVIPVSADGVAYGYQFDDKYLYAFGGLLFPMGKRNVLVGYTAGYTATENDFVPNNPGPYTITPITGGYAAVDHGVTYTATGIALIPVGGTPSAGQYNFANGIYTFAAADTGLQVTLNYDYTPGAIEQALVELVGTILKQRDNLGIASKSLRDEHITFSARDIESQVGSYLWPYRKIVPT